MGQGISDGRFQSTRWGRRLGLGGSEGSPAQDSAEPGWPQQDSPGDQILTQGKARLLPGPPGAPGLGPASASAALCLEDGCFCLGGSAAGSARGCFLLHLSLVAQGPWEDMDSSLWPQPCGREAQTTTSGHSLPHCLGLVDTGPCLPGPSDSLESPLCSGKPEALPLPQGLSLQWGWGPLDLHLAPHGWGI